MSEKTTKRSSLSAEAAWNLGISLSLGLAASSIVIGIAWNSATDNAEEECLRTLAKSEAVQSGEYAAKYVRHAAAWKQKGCFLEKL